MLSDSGAIDSPACSALYPQHHLQVDRQHDHRPAERDLLQQLPAHARCGRASTRNSSGSISVALPALLAAAQPPREPDHRDDPEADQQADVLAALLPDQDAEDDAAHADDGEHGAAPVDRARARVRHVLDEPDAREHDRDDHGLQRESRPATTGPS